MSYLVGAYCTISFNYEGSEVEEVYISCEGSDWDDEGEFEYTPSGVPDDQIFFHVDSAEEITLDLSNSEWSLLSINSWNTAEKGENIKC
jgi:hypothetical protein